jgi:lanosterol synthase
MSNTLNQCCVVVCPGLVIVCHVTNTPLEEAQKKEMIRYLRNVQRDDGGWGL